MTTFASLEGQRREMISMLRDWPAAKLAFRPEPDAWSATEVLDHVVKVEDRITAAARIGLLTPHRIGLRDRLGFLFIDHLFRSTRRVKVPSSVPEVLPDRTSTLHSICDRLDLTRSELPCFLSDLPADRLGVGVFRHPVTGWMTVPQILRFFSVHMKHHGHQLARLQRMTSL
jgi:hypothetical protein